MTTTTITQTSRLACAATFAALCLGATACGTEGNGASPAASIKQAGGQKESRISPRAAEHQAELEQARQLRAEQADAGRWAQGGTGCRRDGHPASGGITCTAATESDAPSNANEKAPTAARPGSYKFPDLLP